MVEIGCVDDAYDVSKAHLLKIIELYKNWIALLDPDLPNQFFEHSADERPGELK
jgi:hypothetical protein